jgi:serine/threonine protein phosphatase PrpC
VVEDGGQSSGRASPFDSSAQSAGLSIGVCSEQGRRPYQEDEYAIRPFLANKTSMNNKALETHFFGLYDGHAGGRCSKYISSSLPDIFADDPAFTNNIITSIKRAYHTANDLFLKIAEKMKLHDGSTGLTCILRDGKITVANVGDCRALLISNGKAIPLSNDQKPTMPEEQKRIAQLGGTVLNCMGVARVNGVLAVSRAFGNRMLRSVIRPDAEIITRDLSREDEYLVMASDGMWDVLRNKDVSDLVSSLSNFNPTHIAEELVHLALSRGSMDNVTCVVVRVKEYAIRMIHEKNSMLPISSMEEMEAFRKEDTPILESSMLQSSSNENSTENVVAKTWTQAHLQGIAQLTRTTGNHHQLPSTAIGSRFRQMEQDMSISATSQQAVKILASPPGVSHLDHRPFPVSFNNPTANNLNTLFVQPVKRPSSVGPGFRAAATRGGNISNSSSGSGSNLINSSSAINGFLSSTMPPSSMSNSNKFVGGTGFGLLSQSEGSPYNLSATMPISQRQSPLIFHDRPLTASFANTSSAASEQHHHPSASYGGIRRPSPQRHRY